MRDMMSKDYMMQVMELRQEAEDASDSVHVHRLRSENAQRESTTIERMSNAFRHNDLRLVQKLVHELTYWNKVGEVLQAKS